MIKSLKQKTLNAAVLGAIAFCTSSGNAHAEEKLSSQEMTSIFGATLMVGAICQPQSPTCTADPGSWTGTACFSKQPLSFGRCESDGSAEDSDPSHPIHNCYTKSVFTCKMSSWMPPAGSTNCTTTGGVVTGSFVDKTSPAGGPVNGC